MARGLTVVFPLLLGGLLHLSAEDGARWSWSGAWMLPVGDPYQMGSPGSAGVQPYQINRGILEGPGPQGTHEGADLSNGHGGDLVRAAANGVVVRAEGSGENGGYGSFVVLGHQLPDGGLVYTVYAHLIEGSVRVKARRRVFAGQPLGRVGMTGHATSPHLHFEVRLPEDPEANWLKSPVVDPVAYVLARLPRHRSDTTWARPYLEWAECGALLSPLDEGSAPVTAGAWWRMLAHASGALTGPCPQDAESLRAALMSAGILVKYAREAEGDRITWRQLTRDLRRLRSRPTRLTYSPLPRARHRRTCSEQLGVVTPLSHPEALAARAGGSPSTAQACLALADLAGTAPAPKPARRAPKRPPPAPADSTAPRGDPSGR